jgi:polyisoprenyl-phosphate glycosyltransferase
MSEIKPTFTIVSPCFNEIENIKDCYEEVKQIFESEPLNQYEREHIIVDDFSTDGTRDVLMELAANDRNVKVIFNARNVGVYRSSFHGLKYATGSLVVPMLPVDLQDPPEFINEMLQKKLATNHSIVYGMRFEREESFVMKQVRRLYYVLLDKSSSIKIPRYAGEFQVIDRWVVDEVIKLPDYYPFLRGKIAAVTSDSIGMHYTWKKRQKGETKHNLLALYDQGVNGWISTSILPLRFMVLFGLILSVSSIFFGALQIILYFYIDTSAVGRGVPTIISGLFFLMGMLFLFFGVIGEYVGAIHSQVRGSDNPVAMKTFNLKVGKE